MIEEFMQNQEDASASITPKGKKTPKGKGKGKGKTSGIAKRKNPDAKNFSAKDRAGLVFPVMRMKKFIRANSSVNRVGITAAIALAGVTEYVMAEIMDLAIDKLEESNKGKKNHRSRVTTRDIFLAIDKDAELATLFKNGIIAAGGAKQTLKPKEAKKSKKSAVKSAK